MVRFKCFLIAIGLFLSFNGFTQTPEEKRELIKDYDAQKLIELTKSFELKFEMEKQKALKLALQKGWVIRKEENGRYYELMKVSEDGQPLYYTTLNVDAAESTRANTLHNGGILGLNVEGQNMEAHVWDGGLARSSHQEYDGAGGNNRFSIGDGTTALHYHAAHVTGTIIASGYVANAKGMAPQAEAIGYDWNNDISEATASAANGMLLSNHSYGWVASNLPDWYFGAYLEESRVWDDIMFNAPYYLMVVAAGNEGNNNTTNGNPLDGNSYYDKLSGHKTSKNNMVVANAQDANIDANGNLVSVNINSGSSEGPTDDYRVKPDITGNGTGLYSTYENADNAYNTISGTSMATPNVTGTLMLLQQHYNDLNSAFMRAATLKGLALHTADDAGPAGPDAVWGWGLLNGKEAAEVISNNGSETAIREFVLNDGESYSLDVVSDGVNDLVASISWTDPAGTPNTGTANDNTPVLVNDLDIRIAKGGSTYYPYKLMGVSSNSTGDNFVDPFEKIIVGDASGSYTLSVLHKGNLSSGQQAYTLIISGLSNTVAPVADFIADKDYPLNSADWVTFKDQSIHVATSWEWTISPPNYAFKNGTNANSQHPVVSFTQYGAYTISLKATNAFGNHTETKNQYIHVGQRGLWVGTNSADWSTATNWQNHEIPPADIDVSITKSAVNWPMVAGNLIVGENCNSLSFGDGYTELSVEGNLVINSDNAIMTDPSGTPKIILGGEWVNHGTFTAGQSTVVFNNINASSIAGAPVVSSIFYDGFETDKGWVLTGEFERDTPLGLGGEYGYPDPDNAYAGNTILGVDLTGLGSADGDYENNLGDKAYQAVSPIINCSGYTNVSLHFMRWLGLESSSYDHGYIEISNDNGSTWAEIWANGSTINDDEWQEQTIDISSWADDQAQVKIRFSIGSTDVAWRYCGWNIDEFNIKGSSHALEEFYNLSIESMNANTYTESDISVANNLVIKPCAYFTNASGNLIAVENSLILEANSTGAASFIDNGLTTVSGDTYIQYYCQTDYWHYISACFDPGGVTFDNLFTNPGPAPNEFYRWDESYNDQGITGWWIDVLMNEWGTSTFAPGQGYAISDYTKGTTFSLSGNLYNSTKSVTLSKTTGSTGEGWNMVGNPFPCAMAANVNADATNNFITRNALLLDNTYAGIYFFDESINDYATVSNGSTEAYISIGQGFMVMTKQNGNSISFHVDDRKHGSATFYKHGDENSRTYLTLTGPDNQINLTEIAFLEGMTKGIDPTYDAGKFKGNDEISLYTLLAGNGSQELAIQALPASEERMVVPVGFMVGVSGTYTISAEHLNFDQGYPITLEDNQENIQVDFAQKPDYTFMVEQPGTFNNRLRIHYNSKVAIEETAITAEPEIRIYASGESIFVQCPDDQAGYSVSVYNISGQLIYQGNYKAQMEQLISMPTRGAYIVKVVTGSGMKSQKVIVD